MDVRKAYGVVSAMGAKLGEKARADAQLLDALRHTDSIEAFRAAVRAQCSGLLPEALVDSFLSEVVTDADWTQWRSRLLLNVKMVRDGSKPAAGHERRGL